MMKLIELAGIRRVYGEDDYETVALDGVNLTIDKGEFVAIVGPSGSGKSTLMHIMGLLDSPTDGSYILNDENIEKLNADKLARLRLKKIGFVFQSFNLLPRTTALENVMLPLSYSVKNHSSRQKRAIKLLEQVGLSDRLDHTPGELSGGQIQKVAIARALANDPEIIFADEPTGNLDTKSGEQILKILQDLNKKGTTVILVTHNPELSNEAKRTINLRDGRIVGDTGPKKVKAKSTSKTKAKTPRKKKAKR